jgi:hypothetical protein
MVALPTIALRAVQWFRKKDSRRFVENMHMKTI